ncbi:MAG: aminotransferase class III-fold pyridoxal phosphate-dependent enzyme, partial [Chthoniobacterales bacterium]
MSANNEQNDLDGIAIIGMAGRFPGAADVDAFWKNLVDGKDTITRFSEEETEFSLLTENAVTRGEKFVRARGVLDNADKFDAEFFGIRPREAEIMDPQHRIFLECAWEALEAAGYDPIAYEKLIGVYAGLSLNTYLLYNLCSGNDFSTRLAGNYQVGEYQAMLGNDKDFMPTRVAYKLNLRGPTMAIQCACSTSLVAIAQACTALQNYQCDMALAGGVSISFPQRRDYRYEEDGMVSPDGTCRAFDADAKGTVFGHGSAVVLLKRLSEAQADGDNILAVIRGHAVNNDGSDKIGYAAPGVNAQADVIAMAQANAGVTPDSISYIEAHGTGTPLGDPIEVAALTKAFREGGAAGNGFCALGTGKTHIGHLDVAAGATGLIKTVLQLQHGRIPPLLHFKAPNPRIDFAGSPFTPVTESIAWKRGDTPRRAGVSAFGVGGTNAHVVLEEAPQTVSTASPTKDYVLVLSARTPAALQVMSSNLADHLLAHPDINIADVAFTLARGRRPFKYRRAIVASDSKSAVSALRQTENGISKSPVIDLWLSGGLPDWDTYFGSEIRRRVPLPTYPFERKRFWVEPTKKEVEPLTEEEQVEEPVFDEAASPLDRRLELSLSLTQLIEELSGSPLTDQEVNFSELGFDSLFLTQVSQAVFSRYGVKVTFRQLLAEISSVARLSAHLDATLPAGAPAAKAAPSTTRNTGSRLPIVRWPANVSAPAAGRNQRFGPYRPIEKRDDGSLTDKQRKALDDLIARYTRRTTGSKNYTAEHRPHYADPRAVSGFQSLWKEMVYPIVSSRSKGATIWDIDENAYVDLTMGFGTYFFGHSPDWLIEAVEKQLKLGIEIGPQSASAGGIARDICEFTGMDRATFCNTGSEAVMAAIRLARTVTGRNRIVYFTGDYHGMFDEVLVRGSWVNGEYRAQPIAPGIPASMVENMLVLDYAAPESLEILRAHAGELAAVLVEPVQSRHPSLQPKAFLHEIRALTARSGTALIFDEVVTGFRCHPGGAQKFFGVEADMATYGKVIGGGIPIGVLTGKSKFMDALDGGSWNYGDDSFPEVGMTFFAGTFVRHPMAMAAARAVLDYLKEQGPGLQLRMTERTDLLCRTLNSYFEAVCAPIRLSNFSAVMVIEHAPDLKYASLLWYYLREKGIHVWENRPIYLTLAHSDEDFDKVIAAFQDSVREMQEAGFLPAAPEGINRLNLPREFPRIDSAPTTEAQREIWASVQMGDDANRAYNESNTIEVNGPLDRIALEKALLHIIQRHSALRSTFSEDGQQQFFYPAPENIDLLVTDLTSFSTESRASRYAELKAEGTGIPFDLTNGPLLRLNLIALEPEKHALIFTAHHMICDGWSFGMIIDELSKSYNAFRSGRVPMLPPPLPFGDYAKSLLLESEDKETARNYWISQFADGAPTLELPTDRTRPNLKSYPGAMAVRVMDAGRFARLKKAVPKLGGTLFVNLLSTFTTLLHRFSGQNDIVVGIPSAGQTLIGRDELIGH